MISTLLIFIFKENASVGYGLFKYMIFFAWKKSRVYDHNITKIWNKNYISWNLHLRIFLNNSQISRWFLSTKFAKFREQKELPLNYRLGVIFVSAVMSNSFINACRNFVAQHRAFKQHKRRLLPTQQQHLHRRKPQSLQQKRWVHAQNLLLLLWKALAPPPTQCAPRRANACMWAGDVKNLR